MCRYMRLSFFFFNDTATTEIYTLSLHDALPIWRGSIAAGCPWPPTCRSPTTSSATCARSASCSETKSPRSIARHRSEEHTSELQSQSNLVCRLLLEKKKKTQ